MNNHEKCKYTKPSQGSFSAINVYSHSSLDRMQYSEENAKLMSTFKNSKSSNKYNVSDRLANDNNKTNNRYKLHLESSKPNKSHLRMQSFDAFKRTENIFNKQLLKSHPNTDDSEIMLDNLTSHHANSSFLNQTRGLPDKIKLELQSSSERQFGKEKNNFLGVKSNNNDAWGNKMLIEHRNNSFIKDSYFENNSIQDTNIFNENLLQMLNNSIPHYSGSPEKGRYINERIENHHAMKN